MASTIKQIFNKKNKDLQKRILFTLFALIVFKIGTAITVPGVKINTSSSSILEIINAMSGGAFQNASIFALSVTPYITAQIIIQLLSMDIVPYLSELFTPPLESTSFISRLYLLYISHFFFSKI